ncbi:MULTISPECIES: hypothetical protein [Sphingomonas]|jgi:hypothetical protein|uniref:hypothetical protein n=1 Tax=Sphingomonas TaxID=13687 RepID=UPI000DBC0CA6|nr:hypothetical protein [Sphingomonas sp.]PZU80505.1 MAG: hypothetical protein DI530_05255 [Sphingomonas sp.]
MTDATDQSEPNEILATVAAAKAHEEAGGTKDAAMHRGGRWQIGKTWLGVGIGSAAVAAAVLFANSQRDSRRSDKKK